MDLFASLIAGPVLPATLLLAGLALWSLLALAGAADLNFTPGGGDLDMGSSLDAPNPVDAASSLGLATLRWLNLRGVPVIVWSGVFVILFWLISINFWILVDSRFFAAPGVIWSSLLAVRSGLIAVLLTRYLTRPMRGWFRAERLTSTSLIGQECEISSLEASPEFGQVKYKTDGSPLLLNVRTDGPHLARGARVWITHYDAQRRVYIVSPAFPVAEHSAHSSSSSPSTSERE
jgi:hypothetical protein